MSSVILARPLDAEGGLRDVSYKPGGVA